MADNEKIKSGNEVTKDKTQTPQKRLDSEGQSIIDENEVNMNKDKSSGRGTLKVRFEMNSPGQSFSEKKPQGSSLKTPSNNGEQLLNSAKPVRTTKFVDNLDNGP